jgi:hypothetical protein
LGTKNTGLVTVCNGWHSGVRVEASHVDGQDIFRVYLTGGSHDVVNDKCLGVVRVIAGRPVFEPEPV